MHDRRFVHLADIGRIERRARTGDRRQHHGIFRWVWFPLPKLWSRFFA